MTIKKEFVQSVLVGSAAVAALLMGAGSTYASSETTPFDISSASSTFVTVTNSGSVGIGTANPTDLLDLSDSPVGNMNSTDMSLTTAPSLGTLTGVSTRMLNGLSQYFTPSGTLSSASGAVFVVANGSNQTLDISGMTLANLSGSQSRNTLTADGSSDLVTGTPVFNASANSGRANQLNVNGVVANVSVNPTVAAGSKNDFTSAAGSFTNGSIASGLLNGTTYGIEAINNANISGTNSTAYGGYFVGGSANTSYGLYDSENSSQPGQAAYGLYIAGPGTLNPNDYSLYSQGTAPSFFQGAVGINVAAPTAELDVNGSVNVGTNAAPTGITLHDTATNQPYCVEVTNGALVTTAGACAN